MSYQILKRGIDIFFASMVLIILLPVLILISLIVFIQDFHSPFFVHERVGKNGKHFPFYKFRSMPENTPNVESKEKEKLTITPFGKILRRTNLDELPQLLAIIKGDMSLIGPRPSIPSQIKLNELRKQNGSLFIKPGLTGWAQVNSYDDMPDEVKAEYDAYYAKNMSFSLDVKIVLKTLLYLTKKPPAY